MLYSNMISYALYYIILQYIALYYVPGCQLGQRRAACQVQGQSQIIITTSTIITIMYYY